MTTTWHADEELLARYAAGEIDDARAYSVEAHVLACETCRSTLARGTDQTQLNRMWIEVGDALDAPRPGVVERCLVRFGVRKHVARLLAATPSLRLSWFAAEAVALGFAVLSTNVAHGGRREDLALFAFLVVAAILPVAGVAASYGPGVDPTYEVGLAAPMRSFRLLMIRSAAVLGASIVVAGASALALPDLNWTAVAWLLPSFGLTISSLALSTYVRPLLACGTVTLLWMSASVVVTQRQDELAVFRGGSQVFFVIVIAVSAWVLAQRRSVFEQGATE
jgi:anti-sigma factor RsiW